MNNFSLSHMAMELLYIDEDIRFRFKNANTRISDFELYDFNQTWESTALGFNGVGGQAITSARTYVFIPVSCDEECFIYFAGKFAYSVPLSSTLIDDIRTYCLEPQSRCGKYLKK